MSKSTTKAPAIQAESSKYEKIIEHVFHKNYLAGATQFLFKREEMTAAASALGMPPIKNIGDVPYSFRYRRQLPVSIRATATNGREWIIRGAGIGKYEFKQAVIANIIPREGMLAIKVPEATPEIITAYALTDEQALLAKVRYNRLIDTFLGVTTYSLQSHLRTTVTNIGQIEIDEVYVGIDSKGRQYIIPVQAKGGDDKHGPIQTEQDILWCAEKFPQLICRAISVQFATTGNIVMFELTSQDDEIRIVTERHYQLVEAKKITADDLRLYAATP